MNVTDDAVSSESYSLLADLTAVLNTFTVTIKRMFIFFDIEIFLYPQFSVKMSSLMFSYRRSISSS